MIISNSKCSHSHFILHYCFYRYYFSMVPQVLEVLVPTISGFTTGREAKLEAGKSEAPVIR